MGEICIIVSKSTKGDEGMEKQLRFRKGDLLATVDMATVMTALSDLQEKMDELDDDINDAKGETVNGTITAGLNGRVKIIYGEKGMDVSACMAEHGALAILSLDGYMAVDLETDQLNKGDTVTIVREEGKTLPGKVESAAGGKATVLVTDNGPRYDEEITVTLEDGTILMPLIIEWSSSEGNSVSDLLKVMLAEADATKAAGMQINQNIMTFTELLNYYYRDASQGDKYAVPTYGMFNLATNFTPTYDMAYEWTDDPDLLAQGYNLNHLYNDSLDALTMNMVYGVDSSDPESYMAYWKAYIMLWNDILPQIPLYSNVYITMYPDWLEGYEQDSFWDFNQAILYATVAE